MGDISIFPIYLFTGSFIYISKDSGIYFTHCIIICCLHISLIKLPQLWQSGAPIVGSCVSLAYQIIVFCLCALSCFVLSSISLFSVTTRYPTLILHISGPSPGMSHFFNDLPFLSLENMRNQDLGAECTHCYQNAVVFVLSHKWKYKSSTPFSFFSHQYPIQHQEQILEICNIHTFQKSQKNSFGVQRVSLNFLKLYVPTLLASHTCYLPCLFTLEKLISISSFTV